MFCTKIQQLAVSNVFAFDSPLHFVLTQHCIFIVVDSGTSGLAMSRSIGDWDAGEVGVIPDPLIDILDVTEIKRKILGSLNGTCNDKEAVEIDPATGESRSTGQCVTYSEEDVKIFAVSATDVRFDSNHQLFALSFRHRSFVDPC